MSENTSRPVMVQQYGPFWAVGITNRKGKFTAFWRGFENEADARQAMVERRDEFEMRLRAAIANDRVNEYLDTHDHPLPAHLVNEAGAANDAVRALDEPVLDRVLSKFAPGI